MEPLIVTIFVVYSFIGVLVASYFWNNECPMLKGIFWPMVFVISLSKEITKFMDEHMGEMALKIIYKVLIILSLGLLGTYVSLKYF